MCYRSAPFAFGCTQLKVPPAHLVKLENNINISPCGVAFVKSGARRGVLPRMLQEILDARLMVIVSIVYMLIVMSPICFLQSC
jgi:DNA polymerase zeta